MRQKLGEKISESLRSVLPITVIVLILSFTLTPMPIGTLLMFILGAVMLIVGMGFFSLGADSAMMPMGESMGTKLGASRYFPFVLAVCFFIGVTVTIAEPDLSILADQVPAVPDMVIVLTVAVGVGIFMMLAVLREKAGWPLSRVLIILYVLVFVLSIFVPNEFLAVAFDAGGVTTGPITVPFILAMGAGLAVFSGKEEGSFGTIALCSVGPILAVMLLGVFYQSSDLSYAGFAIPAVTDSQDVGAEFAAGLPTYLREVAIGLIPIVVFFAIFQIVSIRMHRRPLLRILVGIVYTYVGLVLFLTGANVGFMPAGYFIGQTLAALPQRWVLVPIGMVVGYFIVSAEPAIHVLNKQVEEVTSGAISQRTIGISLSIGVACSLGIAMLRVWLGIPIYWFLIPGYAIALGLTFFVPKIFTAVAFDSGGVASGPMTATFILPMAMGACEALGGNVLTDAFGVVAMVAMTPLITIQVLGLICRIRGRKAVVPPEGAAVPPDEDEIVDYDTDTNNEEV
ncbi:MAG: DUF1538 domain-containing protein [Oscillospiraceae bacterium]|nr:DUF1538 domain-containing protein [Oscillospiraceae bacterium]